MNKNLFKKVVCLVLALLMVIPVMPGGLVSATETYENSSETPISNVTSPGAITAEPTLLFTPLAIRPLNYTSKTELYNLIGVSSNGKNIAALAWQDASNSLMIALITQKNKPIEEVRFDNYEGFTKTIVISETTATFGDIEDKNTDGSPLNITTPTKVETKYVKYFVDVTNEDYYWCIINIGQVILTGDFMLELDSGPGGFNVLGDEAVWYIRGSLEIHKDVKDSNGNMLYPDEEFSITVNGTNGYNRTFNVRSGFHQLLTGLENGTYTATEDVEGYTTEITPIGGVTIDVGSVESTSGTITVTNYPIVNDAPVAVDDAYTTDEDTALTVSVPGILANDTDIDGDALKAVLVDEPANGTLTLNADGSFTYTPGLNFNGEDSFTYKANDGVLDSNEATVTITVGKVNDAPVAVDDAMTVKEDTRNNIVQVLVNDYDVDLDILLVTQVTQGDKGGNIAIGDNGLNVLYTPKSNFYGTETFTYTISDGNDGTDTASAVMTVTNVKEDNPDPPVIIPDPDPPLADLEKFDHFAYVIGYPDGNVKPQNNITREEVAMIFYRLLTDDSRNEWLSDTNQFTDIAADRWSNRAISTLHNAGIIKGYPDGTFKPSDPISRAEFATIAAKFDKLELNSTSKFTDIFGHWAEKYITSSEIKGWIKGYPDLTFKPEQDITRAEAMTLINNVLEREVPEENIHPDAMFWPDMESDDWYYEAVMEATNSHNYIYEEDKDELWTGMKPNKIWP